jgi:hypothetical protein
MVDVGELRHLPHSRTRTHLDLLDLAWVFYSARSHINQIALQFIYLSLQTVYLYTTFCLRKTAEHLCNNL